jgi:aspartate/methionine/tyrosine aminotransferase
MRLADRIDHLGTESAFEVAARARALADDGADIVELHLGEPDFKTPAHIVEAAHRAMIDGYTHYAPPPGVAAFREAIAADSSRRRGVAVSPDRVVVTPGAKPVLSFAMMALLQPGDEVIVPDPGFPIYASMARFMGATPVPLPARAERDDRFDPAELRALVTPRTRMLVLNSPANPTGVVLDEVELGLVAELALEHDLVVLSDEIYARLVYAGEHRSILAFPGLAERTIVLDGLSKSHAMTGWRLGWGILPPALVPVLTRLLINTVSCTATYAQHAGVAALAGPQDDVEAMLAEFRARRTLVVQGLNALPGVRTALPAGAFYAFPDVSETGMSGTAFAERALTEAGVSLLPGAGFGAIATTSVRLSYANSRANLRAALRRLQELLRAGQAA